MLLSGVCSFVVVSNLETSLLALANKETDRGQSVLEDPSKPAVGLVWGAGYSHQFPTRIVQSAYSGASSSQFTLILASGCGVRAWIIQPATLWCLFSACPLIPDPGLCSPLSSRHSGIPTSGALGWMAALGPLFSWLFPKWPLARHCL